MGSRGGKKKTGEEKKKKKKKKKKPFLATKEIVKVNYPDNHFFFIRETYPDNRVTYAIAAGEIVTHH